MRRKTRGGFTLIEALLVVVILGLLALIAIPRFASSGSEAKETACKANIAMMNSQIELWAVNHEGTYPATQTEFDTNIVKNTDLFPDGPPECPFGDAYVYDTDKKRVVPHSH